LGQQKLPLMFYSKLKRGILIKKLSWEQATSFWAGAVSCWQNCLCYPLKVCLIRSQVVFCPVDRVDFYL
jgi:hypothetical protein